MKKRILILGAGNAQIDAIDYCKNNGYEVVGCSYTTVDAGIPLLDYFVQTDIKDVGGVTELAREYKVCAVYSVGSDLAIPTSMKVSETLGLYHFISSETAEICHSKSAMRRALGADFEGNAEFAVCNTIDEALLFERFPCMMKPTDSQGQRGCFKVLSREDIQDHFDESMSLSNEGKVIIEDYIEGPEVSVNAYFQNGDMLFSIISDRFAFEEFPGGIIKKHIIPSSFANSNTGEKIIDLCKRIADKLGIDNGPCYFQIKIKDGVLPVILEVAPRLDGCHMWNLIKHYCGVDLLNACFEYLLENKKVLTDNYEKSDDRYCLEFICEPPNSIFSKDNHAIENVEFLRYYYNEGDRVLKVNGMMEKCGYLIRRTGENDT